MEILLDNFVKKVWDGSNGLSKLEIPGERHPFVLCLRHGKIFLKNHPREFNTSGILQLQLQRVSRLSQRLDMEKWQFSLQLYNLLKNECYEFHYGLKDSIKTGLQFVSYGKAQLIIIGTTQCYKLCHLCSFINPWPQLRHSKTISPKRTSTAPYFSVKISSLCPSGSWWL